MKLFRCPRCGSDHVDAIMETLVTFTQDETGIHQASVSPSGTFDHLSCRSCLFECDRPDTDALLSWQHATLGGTTDG